MVGKKRRIKKKTPGSLFHLSHGQRDPNVFCVFRRDEDKQAACQTGSKN
jgi:hypothetical protein